MGVITAFYHFNLLCGSLGLIRKEVFYENRRFMSASHKGYDWRGYSQCVHGPVTELSILSWFLSTTVVAWMNSALKWWSDTVSIPMLGCRTYSYEFREDVYYISLDLKNLKECALDFSRIEVAMWAICKWLCPSDRSLFWFACRTRPFPQAPRWKSETVWPVLCRSLSA